VERTPTAPASRITRSTGSARSAAASAESSRSARNTGRGAWSTSAVRSHQSRTPLGAAAALGLGDDLAIVAEVLHLADAVVPLPLRRPPVLADRVVAVRVGVHGAADDPERGEERDREQHLLRIAQPRGARRGE